jgi:hypothetical protein
MCRLCGCQFYISARENSVQAFTLHELHHHIVIPAQVPQVVNRNDVWVLEAAERLSLAEESLEQVRIIVEPTCHHLDRYLPIKVRVDGLVDNTHTAAADHVDDVILPDLGGYVRCRDRALPICRENEGRFTGISPRAWKPVSATRRARLRTRAILLRKL